MKTIETRNITLALPKRTLQQVKLLAVERRTSVSALLSQALDDLVRQETRYAGARKRHLAALRRPPILETGGTANWRREDLHDR